MVNMCYYRLSTITFILKMDKLWLVVGVIVLVQCTAPLIEYVLVENGLKRKFDQNGNMRQ